MRKKVCYYLTFLIILAALFFTSAKLLNAQSDATPHPQPENVPCNVFDDDEFHSLRPYQVSPCRYNLEDISLFCGNDFIVMDSVTITKEYYSDWSGTYNQSDLWEMSWSYLYDGQPCTETGTIQCQAGPLCELQFCDPHGDTQTCSFTIDRLFDIAIDLSGAELPIMGYTESSEGRSDEYEVINWVYQMGGDEDEETLESPEKVNEYISWYLNGIIGRAEYNPPDPETEEGHSKIVDFSGPLKRLLSFESQIETRLDEVEDARTSLVYCDPLHDDPDCIRHNQKVGCLSNTQDPIGCYAATSASFARLDYWMSEIHRPPLRRDYETYQEYAQAFDQWRSDPFSKLFSYIPFSSTEDKVGRVQIFEYEFQPVGSEGTSLVCSEIVSQTPSELYFSHMKEAVELAELLQEIHSPQDAVLDAQPLNVQAIEYPLCIIAETRKNPGDYLFASDLLATIAYTAQVECEFIQPGEGRVCEQLLGGECMDGDYTLWNCDAYYNQADCDLYQFCGVGCEVPDECITDSGLCKDYNGEVVAECCPGWECEGVVYFDDPTAARICVFEGIEAEPWTASETCTREVYVSFQTRTMTPLSREAWSRLVANPAAVFRRIFPQIEDSPERPIRRLWDIPAETDVIFSTTGPVTVVGGPFHQLYFPHIGGLHEYFLRCLQKTLRPQGFGQGCISAPIFPPPSDPGNGNPPPTGEIIPGPTGPPPEGCWPLVPSVSYDNGSWTACLCYPYGEGQWGDIWVKVYVNGNLYTEANYLILFPGNCWCISGTAEPGSVVCVEFNSRNAGEQCGGGGYQCFVL